MATQLKIVDGEAAAPSALLAPLAADAEFAKESARAAELKTELTALEDEERALTRKMGEALFLRDRGPEAAAAHVLLRGGELSGNLPESIMRMRERADDLRTRIGVYRAAVALQREAVAKIVDDRSVAIADQVRGEHQKIAGRIAAALRDLREAVQAEQDLFDGITRAGYVHWLPLLSPRRTVLRGHMVAAEDRASRYARGQK